MRRIIFFVFILFLSAALSGQTIIRDSVSPRATDTTIERGAFNLMNYYIKSNQDTMNTLVIFLPGTTREPNDYLYVMDQLALMGYHVIGLMYKTDPPINPKCRSTDDETCHWRARMETIDGTDPVE